MVCHGETVSVSSATRTWVLDSKLLDQEGSAAEYWRRRDNLISVREGLATLDKFRIVFGICVLLGGAFVIKRNVRQRRAAKQDV
jgi:hypothetical protein